MSFFFSVIHWLNVNKRKYEEVKAILEIIWKYGGTLEKRVCMLTCCSNHAIKLHMMLQNSRRACSLDTAKEGISFCGKTKIWKQKERERDYMKKFSSGIRRIPIRCMIFFLSHPMNQYQVLGYLNLHLPTRICSLPCMKGYQANTTLRVQWIGAFQHLAGNWYSL